MPVDVFADLTADTPAGRVSVTGNGRMLHVSFDKNDTFWRVAETFLAARRPERRSQLELVRDVFAATDTEVIFRVESREVARIPRNQRDRLFSRLLGLPGIRVRLIALFRAFTRRPRTKR